MAKRVNFHHQKRRSNRNANTNSPVICCDGSRSAAIKVFFLILLIIFFGFFIKFIKDNSWVEIFSNVTIFVKEVINRHIDRVSNGLISIIVTTLSAVAIFIRLKRNHRCGRPNCKGLQKGNAESHVQLKFEDSYNGSFKVNNNGVFLEFSRGDQRQIEAELKKMTPRNRRAVMIVTSKCGCLDGRLEVPGPKKKQRKIKN